MSGLAPYKRTITAGDTQQIDVRGTTLVLRECQAAIDVSLIENQTSGKAGGRYTLTLRRGEKWFTPQEYDQISVHNTAAFDQVIEILAGSGDYVTPPPDVASADFFVGFAPVTPAIGGTQLVAENSTRKRVIIKAKETNAGVLFVAGTQADAAAGKGLGLSKGDEYPGEARGELWGASADGLQTAYILEEVFNA